MQTSEKIVEVLYNSDIQRASRIAKKMAISIGFTENMSGNIALAVSELASNLIKHAKNGKLIMMPIIKDNHKGFQIESIDNGPGISDVEQALTDGFSTTGSLGFGLGTVNRIMDEFEINSKPGNTYIIGKRWLRNNSTSLHCPLLIDGVSCPRLGMSINGDTFIIKKWNKSALVGVIDGEGYGNSENLASQKAQQYVEEHYDQPLEKIFYGVGRACLGTKGVVMALARFNWAEQKVIFASVGNVEVHIFNGQKPVNFMTHRDINYIKTSSPVITECPWEPNYIMILHSDGLRTHWLWSDFPHLVNKSATIIAQELLRTLKRDEDDATIVVVRGEL